MRHSGAWFAPKRYGYGTGWRVSWQGWVATAVLGAVLTADLALLRGVARGLVLVVSAVIFAAVCRGRTEGDWPGGDDKSRDRAKTRRMDGRQRLFAVIRRYGPRYDPDKPLDAQAGWAAHRAFINRMDAEGLVRLAGPLGDAGGEVLLVVRAVDAQAVEHCMAGDPWSRSGMLATTRIVEWHLRHGAVR